LDKIPGMRDFICYAHKGRDGIGKKNLHFAALTCRKRNWAIVPRRRRNEHMTTETVTTVSRRRDVLTSQPRDIRRMGHDHKMTGEGSSAKTDFEHALLKSCSLLNKDRCLQTLNQPAIHQVTI
jgi:hypothetical protein